MSALELVIWSMALGAIATVGVARLADLLVRPSEAQVRAVAFHATVFLVVLVLSGVLGHLAQSAAERLHVLQVLAGPLGVGLANFWIRGWLSAHQRDRLMSIGLRVAALLLPLGGVGAVLLLPRELQLPAAAGLSLVGSSMTLWLTFRGWLMGDRLALVMAIGCLLTLPAIGGMYALAMNLSDIGPAWQAVFALCAALSNGLAGFVLWRRDRHEWKARRNENAELPIDPVTKLLGGKELVRKLIVAQRRRRRTRRDGAVLAILIFDLDRISAQVGSAGVHEMLITIGGRIQRQVGVVNPVGRYWERCFVTLVEAIHSPAWLRTLGLRVATSLRQPVEVAGLDGQRVKIRLDIGVGVVHLVPGPLEVEDVLHDAEQMAEAARGMRSRAAIMDPTTGKVVPVEVANLGPRRHRHGAAAHADAVPHAVPGAHRPARG
ncbi:diguanylate cyclase domain-containing protein [Ramlibacter sp.]|uniref:diguanylate cyclase domain-containing protein n=1 Tax=Ramlibacter sp. TaxID=1917967 RepID=UPI0035ADA96C